MLDAPVNSAPMPPFQTPDPRVGYSSRTQALEAKGHVLTLEGDVVVRYAGTKLLADRAVIYYDENRGMAEGNVTLIDPDGTAHADRIEFGWDPAKRFAKGENVELRVQGAVLKARRADLNPGQWDLYDAEGTSCLRPKPVYYVTSDHVRVVPGKQATIHEPRVSLLGRFVAEAPTQRIGLSRAVPGLRLPAPAFKPNQGFGATWSGGVLAGRNGTFFYDARAFQGSKPSASSYYTRSFVPVASATQIVSPRTDFAERFYFGYLDAVTVESPRSETEFLRAKRASLSFGGQLNGSVVDRDRQTRYSKVEGIYESGGARRGFGLLGQLRLQGLQREETGMEPRASLMGSVEAPSLRLGSNLQTLVRFDGAAFGGRTLFGWGRTVAGLTYAPTRSIRLSAAAFGSFEAGDPQFDIDPLYSKGGALLRADLAFGGTRLSILAKNDVRRGWYDTEFALNQVIGCVEATYVSRGWPRRSQIGVGLRIQPLLDLVQRRADAYKDKKPAERTDGLGPVRRP